MKSKLYFEVGIKDVQKSLDEQKKKIKDWANNNPIELKIELQSLKSQLQALGVAFGSNNKQIQGLSKEVDKAMDSVEKKVKSTSETVSKTLAANNTDKLHKRIAEVDKALQAMNNHNLKREGGDVFQVLFSRRIKTLEEYKEALKAAAADSNIGKKGYLQGLQFGGEQLLGSVNRMLVSPGTISSVRKEMDNILKYRRELTEMEGRYMASRGSISGNGGAMTEEWRTLEQSVKANAERLKANAEFVMSTLRELQTIRAKVLASGKSDGDMGKTINDMKSYVAEMQRLGNSTKALGDNKLMESINQGLIGKADTLHQLIQMYRELYGLTSGGAKGKTVSPVIDSKSINEAVYQVSQLENKLSRLYALEAKASDMGIDTSKMRTVIQEMEGYLKKFREVVDNGGKSNGGLSAQLLKSEGEFRSFTGRIAENSREMRENINEKRRAAAAEGGLQNAIHSSTSAMRNQSQVLSDLRSMAQQYVSVWAAHQFVNNIIEQGGQLEQQRLSIQAILGDAAQAQNLFNQVKALAIKSPFGVTEIDQMTKQLSAYGFQYNELFDLTKRLADISAATGTEVSRLALALGHVRSEAALSGYTLRQFSMANVPLLTKLTEKLGVSAKEVRDMVRKKEIGYDQVLEILKELTDESGMFYNAQEVMSEALNAKFKNLRDSFQIMYSEMAEGGPGRALKSLAGVLTDLSRNWKVLMPMLMTGAGAIALQKLATLALNKGLAVTVAETNAATAATAKYTAAEMAAIKATGKWTLTLRGLGAALKSIGRFMFNPVTLGLAAVEGLVYLWQRHNQELEKAKELTTGFKQEGSEGVRNLRERINATESSDGKSDSELRQGIDSMTATLRDYRKDLDVGAIFNEAFGKDKEDKVKSLAEQYDYLRGKLEDTLDVYEELQKTADAFEYGINNTDGGWFDDNVETNLTDYANAVKELDNNITSFIMNNEDAIVKSLETIKKMYPSFAEVTKDMKSSAEQIKWILENSDGNKGLFTDFKNQIRLNGGNYGGVLGYNTQAYIESQKAKAMADLDTFMDSVEAKLKGKGYNFNALEPKQIDNLMKQSRAWIDKHPEWANIMDDIKSKLEVRWPIKLEPENTNVGKDLEDWQVQMQTWLEAHGKPLEIKPDMRREDIVKMVHDKIKEAQTVIDQSSPLLLRFGVDLQNIPDSDNLPAGLQTPWGEKSAKDYKTESAKYQSLMDFLKEFALPEPKDKNKGKGRSEDKALKEARTRLEETKAFLSEYKKYRETYGKDRAVNILEDLFPTTKGRGVDIVENYKKVLNEIKGSLKLNTDERKKFGISIDKLIADTNLTEAKEKLDRQMKQMESYISENAEKFDLYKALFEKTGNKDFASDAFLDGQVWDDIASGMADVLRGKMGDKGSLIDWNADKLAAEDWFKKNFANGEELYKLWEKIVSLISGNYKDALNNYADAISYSMTYAEKIEAIHAKYAEKNRTANSKREIYANEQKEREEIDRVQLEKLKDEINWEDVFSKLTTHSVLFLNSLKTKLQAALDSKAITAENAKVISEKIIEIEEAIAGKTNIMSAILPGLRERLLLTERAKAAETEYKKALEEEAKAINDVLAVKNAIKAELDKVDVRDAFGQKVTVELEAINEENKENLLASIEKGSDLYNALLKLFKDLADSTANAQGKQEKTSSVKSYLDTQWDKLKNLNKVTDVFSWAKGGNPLEIMQGVADNARSMSDFVDKIGIGNTDFGEAVHEFSNGVTGFNSAIQALAKGDVFGAVNGVLDGIAGFGRSAMNIIVGGGNVSEMEAEIAELSDANDRLSKSIDDLAQSIKDNDNTNAQSEEAYRQALKAEKEWEANQRAAISARASEWSNSGHGFLGLGGKSSFNHYLNHSGFNWDAFNKVLSDNGYSTRVYSADDLWQLSPEMMKLLRDYAPEAWAQLLNTDGESNPGELLDAYIERAGKIDELTSALNEKLTGYSWDGFKGSYVDMLKDLDSTNQDFADNLQDMLTNAILSSLINEKYKERIKSLYDMISDASSDESEGGSKITENEIDAIRKFNQKLADDMIAERNALIEAGILSEDSKNGSSMGSSIKNVTEETASILSAYVNTIRADVSINRDMIIQYFPYYKSLLTSGNQSLKNIEANTTAIMRNSDIISAKITSLDDNFKGLRNKVWKLPVS